MKISLYQASNHRQIQQLFLNISFEVLVPPDFVLPPATKDVSWQASMENSSLRLSFLSIYITPERLLFTIQLFALCVRE